MLGALLLTLWGCGHEQPEEEPFFYEQRLYAPGDYGSANWRIPALCCLEDGSLLAVCDKRKHNESDLPQDIDIVVRRSTDKGRTWSEPTTLAEGQGVGQGYGDAAVAVAANGDVVCVYVGGNGLWQSTEANPIRSYVRISHDNGQRWDEPRDLTATIWGTTAYRTECRNYKAAFFGSGNGLRLRRGPHAGRILFASALCRKTENVLDNYVVYSDDNGQTWQVSALAYSGGDEAKLMELSDGRVLISVRQSGARGYNISNDGGENWGTQGRWHEMTTNACNGDMLRVSAADEGGENLLLHSIPNSMQRENVSLFLSHDEGQSWETPVSLYAGPSVYSSLTLLPDGSIGALVEKNPNGACEIWYMNFTMAWVRERIGQ